MHDWKNPDYLKNGNSIQQNCFWILHDLNIIHLLLEYDPLVVGTIPIGINIEGSDIDIICNVEDFTVFHQLIIDNFSCFSSFQYHKKVHSYTAGFIYENVPIEIYAEKKDTVLQNGFRHMMIEYRLLRLADKYFRQQIIKLKEEGYKTEPAFGKLLHMEHPYEDLLLICDFNDEQLKNMLKKNGIGLLTDN